MIPERFWTAVVDFVFAVAETVRCTSQRFELPTAGQPVSPENDIDPSIV